MMPAFHPRGGAARDRHERGMECDGRERSAWRAMRARTAKARGPDAPTLASSSPGIRQAMVANRPGHQGERAISRKPLRRECRCFGFACSDYACVLLLIAHKAAGAAKHPILPAPSVLRGRFAGPTRARMRCGTAEACLDSSVIPGRRSAASPESIATAGSMDSGPAPCGASRNDDGERWMTRQLAASSRSSVSSRIAASGSIGSPKAKPCAYSQPN
jgi:hypothetical protein